MEHNLALDIHQTPAVPAHETATAEQAIYEAVHFLRASWAMSGSALAKLLHLPINTVNHWLARKRIPYRANQACERT